MNRKIIISGLSIIASLTLAGGATFALFSATASSTGNTFASGTLNLLVDDTNELTPAPSVTGSLVVADFAPGASTTGFISLHNPGTLPIAEVELSADTSETADPGADSDLRNVLELTVNLDDLVTPDTACADGVNLTSTIDTAVGNGDGTLTLMEFDNGTDVYDALPGLTAGQTRNVCFTVTFSSGAGNEYQGDAASTSFAFTANQLASQ